MVKNVLYSVMSTPNFIYDIKIIFKDECGVLAANGVLGEHCELVTSASSPSLFYGETFALSTH